MKKESQGNLRKSGKSSTNEGVNLSFGREVKIRKNIAVLNSYYILFQPSIDGNNITLLTIWINLVINATI